MVTLYFKLNEESTEEVKEKKCSLIGVFDYSSDPKNRDKHLGIEYAGNNEYVSFRLNDKNEVIYSSNQR